MADERIFGRILPRFQTPPEWGIEPVPRSSRVLGFMDFLVLWGDLGIGLLVMLGGTFLVPGLGLGGVRWAGSCGRGRGSGRAGARRWRR